MNAKGIAAGYISSDISDVSCSGDGSGYGYGDGYGDGYGYGHSRA